MLGPQGQRIALGIATTFGRSHFRAWGSDYETFMSPEQFKVFRDSAGQWMVEHCASAKNSTNLNGQPLSGPQRLGDGAQLTLGRTGKCPIRISVK